MSDRLTWLVEDAAGQPLPTATPIAAMYGRTGNVRTPAPTVVNLGGGIFAVTPTDEDTAAGCVVFVDNGASTSPRYVVGVSANVDEPIDAFLLTSAADDSLWTGAAPTLGLYVDDDGAALTQPGFLALAGAYLYALQPLSTEGANYRVDAPSGALLDHSQGAFIEQVTSTDVNSFGADDEGVRRAYFPNWSPFSTKTNPTKQTVLDRINEEAADLAGELRVKSIDPTSITDSSSEAYAWCAKTLKLMVAVWVYGSVTAGNPDAKKALEQDLARRLAWLQKHGLELGGAQTLLSTSPEGPTSHITRYGLTTADSSRMSSTESPFHKDDKL